MRKPELVEDRRKPACRAPASELWSLLEQMGAAVLRVRCPSLEVTFFGARASELLGAPWAAGGSLLELLPEEERSRVAEYLRAVSRDGEGRTFEHAVRVVGRGPLRVRTSVVRGPQAEAAASELLVSMLDITAAREDERQWREVESWLAALGESLPFDFWICDSDGRYVLQNPTSTRHLGNALGQRVGAALQPAIARALGGEAVREEAQDERGGERRFYTRVISPIREGAEVKGALGVDIDVTALKRAEASLRRSVEQLWRAEEAVVRTRQLALLGEMAGMVAHEVRNPLCCIGNALAVLRRTGAMRLEDASLWQVIEEETARIDWLVANLLELARPLALALEQRPLVPLVEEALAQALRAEHVGPELVVHTAWQGRLAEAKLDPSLLKLALVNVLRNAIQAMEGKGELQVKVTREGSPGAGWARVEVRDNGPGIPLDQRERLFEPLFATRATGSGLGLAIVRRVVDGHGGTVALLSEEVGTTCVISLPLTAV